MKDVSEQKRRPHLRLARQTGGQIVENHPSRCVTKKDYVFKKKITERVRNETYINEPFSPLKISSSFEEKQKTADVSVVFLFWGAR